MCLTQSVKYKTVFLPAVSHTCVSLNTAAFCGFTMTSTLTSPSERQHQRHSNDTCSTNCSARVKSPCCCYKISRDRRLSCFTWNTATKLRLGKQSVDFFSPHVSQPCAVHLTSSRGSSKHRLAFENESAMPDCFADSKPAQPFPW